MTSSDRREPRSVGAIRDRVRKARLEIASLKDGAAAVAPGYVLSTEYSVKGAIKYMTFKRSRRDVMVGNKRVPGEVVNLSRIIEDEGAYAEAQKIYSEAVILTDRLTSPYINGLKFADPDNFAIIDRELAPLRERAQDLNDGLSSNKSMMRIKIEIYKFLIDTDDRRNSIRLAQLIHERLTQLRDVYTNTRRNAFRIYMDNVINLPNVVTGKQRELVELAIASTVKQRPIMIANYGGFRGTQEALDSKGKIKPFDYEAIDTAIEIFAPSLKLA